MFIKKLAKAIYSRHRPVLLPTQSQHLDPIWTQEWTQCEFFFIDFIGFIWTQCGPNVDPATKKKPYKRYIYRVL